MPRLCQLIASAKVASFGSAKTIEILIGANCIPLAAVSLQKHVPIVVVSPNCPLKKK